MHDRIVKENGYWYFTGNGFRGSACSSRREAETACASYQLGKDSLPRNARNPNITEKLNSLDACGEAIKWVTQQPDQTPEVLWRTCERGDWMLWILGKLDVDRKRLVLAACDVAETALVHVPEGEIVRRHFPLVQEFL